MTAPKRRAGRSRGPARSLPGSRGVALAAPALAAAAVAAAAALAAAAGCRPPPAPPAPPAPAPTIRDPGSIGTRAFQRMKELAGNWLAGDVPVTFEVIDRGNAIVQRGGFFVVWHPDGNTLAAWVIADEGYHARLRSTAIDERPGGELEIELGPVDFGNIVPDEPLARGLAMTLAPKNDRVTQRWSFGKNLDAPPRELSLVRTDTGALPPSTKQPPPAAAPAPGPAPAPGA
ncbi:MAG TPA: hypothetical protein VNO30_42600 [Kofleriaceae bacterium]|nr:hypothetical protein [Kofleriaceae bacterium]